MQSLSKMAIIFVFSLMNGLVFWEATALAQHEFEKGDAVYRKAAFPISYLGHAALYRDWNFVSESSISCVEMSQQRIIEMQLDGGIHTDHTVQDSINAEGETNFWGVAYKTELSDGQRRKIISTALAFCSETKKAQYGFFGNYKNPTGDPPQFRCDGLVEYCYEIALGHEWAPGDNQGIIQNDTYKTLSPIKQFVALTKRLSGDDPTILVKDSSGQEIPDGELTSDHNIIVEATDGDDGSGITRLEVWRGNPNDGGTEITSFRDNSDYDVNHTYNLNNLPGGDIYIRIFDQAGNESLYNILIGQSIDLVFIVDTTGSMWDDIAAAKSAAVSIVDQIDSQTDDYRIAVVDFRDFPVLPYGGSGDYPYYVDLPFSSDKASIVSAIQGLSLGWGADWRESHYSAMMHCFQKENIGGWRDNVKKVAILMTDAPPHDPEPYTGYTMSNVISAAIALDPVVIYPISIGWDSTVRAYMEGLADGTEGQVFTASGAGEVVEAIMEAIETTFNAPMADANGPYTGTVGSPVTLDGSGSYDSDGNIVSYEWDWDGDGIYDASISSPTITYVWNFEFLGTIQLRVTDNDGLTAIDTASVEITAPAVPGDFDGDGDCDYDDYLIFRTTYGSCEGDANFMPVADLDKDGCITMNDYRILRTLM